LDEEPIQLSKIRGLQLECGVCGRIEKILIDGDEETGFHVCNRSGESEAIEMDDITAAIQKLKTDKRFKVSLLLG
jgi:hypothetical protein